MQKVIKAIKDCVASKTCCDETGVDCNQGRNCPVREGTHKPAEAVHQIQEPTVNQQLTIEREAFGIPQCPFPCGWKNLHTLLVAEGAFLAQSLKEDGPITEHQRATVMRVVNYGLEMARAALDVTPVQSVVLPGTDAVISEVMELVKSYTKQAMNYYGFENDESTADSMNSAWVAIQTKLRALLATGGQAQAVASIYVTEDGQRECDDWKVPLPVGRNLLYAAPQAQADARDAEWLTTAGRKHGFRVMQDISGAVITHSTDSLRAAIAAAKGE